MRHVRRLSLLTLSIILIGGAGLFLWATLSSRPAMGAALEIINSQQIQRENNWVVFRPNSPTTTGFIYYPGGLVEPEAYAVTAQGLADAGYLVVMPDMPLNLAVMRMNLADDIIQDFSEIESWSIGGHSLGGTMAAEYAKNNTSKVDGLVLFASYPANTDDFLPSPLPILSIYGTNESGAPEMIAFQKAVGDQVTGVAVNGGNHAQFGNYGLQGGDGTATISANEQQAQIIDATLSFLKTLE